MLCTIGSIQNWPKQEKHWNEFSYPRLFRAESEGPETRRRSTGDLNVPKTFRVYSEPKKIRSAKRNVKIHLLLMPTWNVSLSLSVCIFFTHSLGDVDLFSARLCEPRTDELEMMEKFGWKNFVVMKSKWMGKWLLGSVPSPLCAIARTAAQYSFNRI